MNLKIPALLLILVIFLSGCVQSEPDLQSKPAKYAGTDCGDVILDLTSQKYECFVSNLGKCSPTRLHIEMPDTRDVYQLETLGLTKQGCELKLTLEEAHNPKLSSLEGKSIICPQKNITVLEEAENRIGQSAVDFVDRMITGIIITARDTTLCKGDLV